MKRVANGLFPVRFYVLLTCLSLGLGVVISLGGPERFSEPSFGGPRAIVEWMPIEAHYVWGALFALYSVFLIAALGRAAAARALQLGTVLYFFLGAGFIGSAVTAPTANLVLAVVFVVAGAAHALLADHFNARGWEG